MERLTPMKIAEVTGGQYIGDPADCLETVTGAVRDNRDAYPGSLFVCIRGARTDGHDYANSAFESGAVCCLAEREIPGAKGPYVLVGSTLSALRTLGGWHRKQFDKPVIGITGSVGKTTAKEMIAAALGTKLRVLKTMENLNNEIGVPLTLLSLNESYDAAVIEMGISEFGEMSRLSEMVRPDICVMTKIGYAHLEALGDLNGVLRAKSEVFEFMKPDAAVVVNGDDELLRALMPGLRKTTFGIGFNNDVYADCIRTEGTSAVTFDIVYGMERYASKLQAYGSHLVLAALAAFAVARLLGVPETDITEGLLSYTPVGGRANVRNTGFITLIDDCYNANPNSMKAALTSLSALPGRSVAILGDMLELGEQSEQLHREIGEFTREFGINCVLCCGDMALYIYKGASGADTITRYYPGKTGLLAALPELIQKGDNVLVKASHGMAFDEITAYFSSVNEPLR